MKRCHWCGAVMESSIGPFCLSRSLIPGERFPHETAAEAGVESAMSNAYADYLTRQNRARSRGAIIPRKKK